MVRTIPGAFRSGPINKPFGQETNRRKAEAIALAGLNEPVLFVPLQPGKERSESVGLSLRGHALLGPATRALEVSVRETFAPVRSHGDNAKPVEFELKYHGLMLPGAHGAVPLQRIHDVLGIAPVWRGSQAFLSGQFIFHLIQLEPVLPGHGWVATMCVEAESASQ